ncbi:aspartate aminotransferase family protein [Terrihabitans soli]|uniref:Aspartate aminotransferase family protein n=1 Tax=Terrihabitans soli TaxID=708113 RepID=A0A6S6QSA2_9HYPH|nr:aminotransferase class III-fold pyridoxal phosphate-dependent enzyme [Terrihabitans soli]BCJ89931.1 aspartate aminotransferase family protein [Terrihabitans soli]
MAQGKQILALNRFDSGQTDGLSKDIADLVKRRHSTFGASSVLFYEQPLQMVRAEGVFMYDSTGRRYLDVYNNVPSVGHCHPRVVEAISKQAATLNTNTRYLYDIVHTYAERLLATFPDGLSNVVFTCTGSESNDLALRLAKIWTGGAGFIVTETAYHGNTAAVMEISPSSTKSRKVPAHVRTVPAPDLYSDPVEDIGAKFASDIAAAIEDLENNGVKFAGLIVDSIFSSDGIHADPPGFLKAAVDLVHKSGGVFIADEVQPGFGRTGRQMWGFQRHGVIPDIVTMGKPMGNGFPMGGVVTRPEILTPFCEETGYFNTFGGNPVAAAAGLAVLDVIEDEKLMHNAEEVGSYFRTGLRELSNRFPSIGDVRGAGLFTGVEFSTPDHQPDTAMATYVINAMKERGVLIGAAGSHGNTLKVRPPLCFARADADLFFEAMESVLAAR